VATTTTKNIYMVETRDALLIVVVVPSLHRSTRQSKAKKNQSQAREAKPSVR
jgi:ribosome recycling factor